MGGLTKTAPANPQDRESNGQRGSAGCCGRPKSAAGLQQLQKLTAAQSTTQGVANEKFLGEKLKPIQAECHEVVIDLGRPQNMENQIKETATVASQMRKARCAVISNLKPQLEKRDNEMPWILVDASGLTDSGRRELADWIIGIGCSVECKSAYLKVSIPRNEDWRRLMSGLRQLHPKVWVSWPSYLEDEPFFEYLRHPKSRFSRHCKETGQFPTMTLFENWSGITAKRRRSKSRKRTATKQ